jgi:uncharacterized membrane protein YcjF (UPF0283 family)
MNRKAISIVLIIVGAALLFGSVVFVVDGMTAEKPAGLGEQILKILGILIGAGTGLKGWLDLRKVQSSADGERTQEAIDSPDSEQTMKGKGGVQKQKSVRSAGSKQNME